MNHPWAKYQSEGAWHPLVAHSAEVAAVMEMLLRRTILGRRMAHLLGHPQLSEIAIQRLGALAALHDVGKANQGFQNRAFGRMPTADHVTPIIALRKTTEGKRHLWMRLGLADMQSWFQGGGLWEWLQTTWSHHGAPVTNSGDGPGLWTPVAFERMECFKGWIREWYPAAFGDAEGFPSGPFQHLFNGILTLADWIGSDTSLFPLRPERVDPAEAMSAARREAEDALRSLALIMPTGVDTSLRTVLGGFEPYDFQAKVQNAHATSEGAITTGESATGTGKSESALGRYATLLDKGLVDSMFFAVPTRAAAKQLHSRIEKIRTRVFGRPFPPVHLAVPDYLRVDDVEGTRLGWQVRWDEDVGHRGWAAESSKRYTASPIAVGTVDQVLMTALKVKHAHLRLAGLARSFLVIDEVHASSTYMNEVLANVLKLHKRMGGHSLLMSATLGSHARAVFTGEKAPGLEEAKKQPYPLITNVSGSNAPVAISASVGKKREKVVEISLKPVMRNAEQIAAMAESAARKGAHVLVIRNTVAACQTVHRLIAPELSLQVAGKSTPHHSRYCAEDRELLDAAIEDVYGKHEGSDGLVRRLSRGVATVATQTVEQSLDIDADLLITDLCPMDVLLQRIGRLHRHDRKGRPSRYGTAQCIILTPGSRHVASMIDAETGKAFPGPGLGSVYADLRIIEATWRALEQRHHLTIPEDNRTLVEEATHPEALSKIESEDERWITHKRYLDTERREEIVGARNVMIVFEDGFMADANGFPRRRPKTRLGQEDVVVALPEKVPTPLGSSVQELTLSPYLFPKAAHWPPESGEATSLRPLNEGFSFSFAGQQFTYTSIGIQRQT